MKVIRFIGVFTLVILLVFFAKGYMIEDDSEYIKENNEHIDKENYYSVPQENGFAVIFNGEQLVLESYPSLIDDDVYLPYSFVKAYINDDFYWDEREQILTFTTINKVMRMRTDELTYYLNDEPSTLQIPVKNLNGEANIPLSLVEKFSDFEFRLSDAKTLVLEDLTKDRPVAIVKRKAIPIRLLRDYSSKIVDIAENKEMLLFMDSDTIWTKVLSDEGFIGYVKTADIDRGDIPAVESKKELYDYERRMTFEGGLNLSWHQVSNVYANAGLKDVLEGVHYLDVISPTWFHFNEVDGTLSNIADLDYVREAHSRGIQVWALFSNSFDAGLSHQILSSTSSREKVIKQLLYFASIYELDGINVDFENLAKEDGEYFIQFIKELAPYLKAANLVLSVDMYVPSTWTEHYGRKEIGEIVDYIMVMTYDEHWSTSPKAGSVASLPFVDKGIRDTLKDVPKQKVVMGLPFYTRVWTENKEGVSSVAYGMEYAAKLFAEKGVRFEWLEKEGQFYGEYHDDKNTYKLWLEDDNSVEEKMKIYDKYDLAGVASWKIGLESDGVIWRIINSHLK